LLDDPQAAAASASDMAEILREVRRLNRLGGGTATVRHHVTSLISGPEARLLDVGTGAADTPVALYRWAERTGIRLAITGLDVSPQALDEARRLTAGYPITLTLGDARALPWPEGSFDVVTCLGVLHHFDETDARQVLREMWRVARVGIVVVDLERSYPLCLAGRLALRALVRHPITRHDGLVSILRSFTRSELRTLARAAELSDARVRRHRLFLQALVTRKA
jgi:ubiquinone/menaquinone biosynthesis C-methylase UbiE